MTTESETSSVPPITAPQRHKAIVVTNPGADAQIDIKEVPTPQPGPQEILIQLSHTGVCHADVSFMFGGWDDLGFRLDGSQTPGHEGVGRVVSVGSEVSNFCIGDRVGTKWLHSVCGNCAYCKSGREHMCPSQVHYGRNVPGSFQQYVLAVANYTPRIPSAIPDDKAGPLLCAGVTMYRGLKISRAQAGDWVVIVGAGGGLGHLGIQFASKMGLKVIGIDSGDKESFCMSLGLDAFVDFGKTQDVPAAVRELTTDRHGATAVLVTAGTRRSYEQATQMLCSGGTLLCIGLPSDPFNVPLQPIDFLTHGYFVTGVNASPLREIEEAMEFAAQHQISPAVEVFPLSKAKDAFEKLHRQKALGRVVLDLRSP